LRLAREDANLRQEDAARVIGVSRPTLVSIENGSRRVRIQEVQALAAYYGVTANALLRREAVHTDLLPRFRKLRETESLYVVQAVQLLSHLVKGDVELENTLGIQRIRNYPTERGIASGDVVELAERHAQELRDWLGLGSGPIADIFSLIEMNLGIRLYQRRLSSKSKVAGLFAYDASVGACILLNANHPWERRVQSAAHELGHFVGTRQAPEVLADDEPLLSRAERYAQAFGRSFLTPRLSFTVSFQQVTAGMSTLTRRHVILLAYQYNISREACVRRLEELGLTKRGVWEWFAANGGITNVQVKEVLGSAAERLDLAKDDADRMLSHRMSLMAYAAWRRELLTEEQLSGLLGLHRSDLRKLLDEIALEESETNEMLKLPRL
jgi:Zn-dependent peptidase ImmA (M78 family)